MIVSSEDNKGGPPAGTSYVYDAENRLSYTSGYTYLYDGDGQRVAKCTTSGPSTTCAGGSAGTLYFRNSAGETFMERDVSGNLQNEYVFFNGSRLARVDSSHHKHYYFKNHLMSTEVVTGDTGSVEMDVDYTPYGSVQDGTPTEKYLFTGKERDSETGLDYFGARYYGSNLGRFASPDPIQFKTNRLLNPQRLNLYTYGVNNPLVNVDPDGRDAIAISFSDYRAQGPLGIHYPFTGHAAVITIDSHGKTRMYEYGRYDKPGEKGVVRRVSVPDVVMKDGKPTDASMKNLMGAVAKSEKNYQGTIDGAYFRTSDKQTQDINNYAAGREGQNSDPNRTPYNTGVVGDANNCATFARDAVGAGGVDVSNAANDIRPASTVSDLQKTADETIDYNAKTKELKREEKPQ